MNPIPNQIRNQIEVSSMKLSIFVPGMTLLSNVSQYSWLSLRKHGKAQFRWTISVRQNRAGITILGEKAQNIPSPGRLRTFTDCSNKGEKEPTVIKLVFSVWKQAENQSFS